MSDTTAHRLWRWAEAVFLVAALGTALGEVAVQLGAGANVRTLLAKVTSLLVHTLLIVLAIRTRHAASARIRGDSAEGSLRGFLAEIWPFAAVFFLAAFWVVWALSVANGFQRALRFLAVTAAVLVASRLLWIAAAALIDRGFARAGGGAPAEPSRYHVLLRHVLSLTIGVATVIALLQAWGVDALAWFESGTVGRRILSAAVTIAIAAVLAIAAWEALSLALNRRVRLWTDSGDVVRAARLRTLVPMIRTCVLVVIALVVLMTALNELGVNVAPLLAGASIIGVALGFGSQKLVQDFITGIFLLMENAMQVGDWVTVAGVSGTVEYLSIRTVRLRAGDGSLHVVPFSSVTTVNNVNRGIGNASVRVSVTAGTDIDAAFKQLRAISDAMRADPVYGPMMLADIDIWGVDQIDGAMATIAGQIRTTDKGRWPVQREFNRRVLRVFRAGNLILADPRETLVATVDEAGKVSAGVARAAAGKPPADKA